jgi:hypothetical protein
MRIDRLDHLVLTVADLDATMVEPDFRICGTAARAIADLAEPPPVP